ncbi:MAG: hypothetical protein AB8I08_34300 [Sandaracinaceae bacterium]
MGTWWKRALTLGGLGLALFGIHFVVAPLGYGWVVKAVGGGLLAWLALELVLSSRRRRREQAARRQARAALGDARLRRRVRPELRRQLTAARRLGRRTRVRQARLALALAELALADGDTEDAIKTLAKVPVEELESLVAAVVRLARGQAYLHRQDTEGARATLKPLGDSIGDPALDASLAVAWATVDHLEGRPGAEAVAEEVRSQAEAHDELWDEATALLALSQDDPAALGELRAEGRARLSAVSVPAVRAWLAAT